MAWRSKALIWLIAAAELGLCGYSQLAVVAC
jgi:hypothetical protein